MEAGMAAVAEQRNLADIGYRSHSTYDNTCTVYHSVLIPTHVYEQLKPENLDLKTTDNSKLRNLTASDPQPKHQNIKTSNQQPNKSTFKARLPHNPNNL